MSNSYEELRDNTTGEGAEAWRAADRETSKLHALYASLREDPRYTEEHKAETAWTAYEWAKDKIAADKVKARELLEKQARSSERFSIPMPEGEHVVTTDPQKLLLSQNEAARIVRKLDRMDSNAKGPFKPKPAETLKSEFQRGLEVGGVQGGAICRGVLSATDELGVDKQQIVNDFRTERHHKALEDAERASMLTQLISRRVSEPPFKRPALSTPRRDKLFIPRDRPAQLKRSPPWR